MKPIEAQTILSFLKEIALLVCNHQTFKSNFIFILNVIYVLSPIL
jgi:hypothetical protein